MNRLFTVLAFALISLSAMANNKEDRGVLVKDVNVSRQKTTFVITYGVSLGNSVKSCNISLLLSKDGGVTYVPVDSRNLSGDIGRIKTSGQKTIRYDFSQDVDRLADTPLSFKVDVTGKDVIKDDILITGQIGFFPQLSYGLMFGMVKKFGWYVKARSDFHFPSIAYNCNSSGEIQGGGEIQTTGKSQKTRLNVTGGALFRGTDWLYPYVGLGYGSRSVCWQDSNMKWVKVTDQSCAGVALDAGVIFRMGKFALSLGVSNTMFKYTEFEAGIGVMF